MSMVELKNIHKSFGENHILKGVDMEIDKGEVVVILGPSGSGKTTLLRTINFLDAADDGSVSVNGFAVDCKKHSKSQVLELRRKTAMVFQNYNLFQNKTIIQNVMEALITVRKYNKKNAEKVSREILKKVGLEERCDFYPAQLSGGMKQRAALLRTYLFSEKVALLDEPFSALDMLTKGAVHEWYLDVMDQIQLSTIFITHDIDEAILLSDRIYLLTGKPGTITKEIVLKEPKPRRMDFHLTKEFLDYKKEIIAHLGQF